MGAVAVDSRYRDMVWSVKLFNINQLVTRIGKMNLS